MCFHFMYYLLDQDSLLVLSNQLFHKQCELVDLLLNITLSSLIEPYTKDS
jgi:hypothetical protein